MTSDISKSSTYVYRDPVVRDQDSFKLMLDGEIVDASWNSKGAALAAIPTERLRRAKKLQRQPWPSQGQRTTSPVKS